MLTEGYIFPFRKWFVGTRTMERVGYSDVKVFRELFRKFVGMSPLEYKRKYYNDSVMGR